MPNVPIVIFPLLHKKDENMKTRIVLVCNEVGRYLMDAGLESFVDLRRKKLPREKYSEWEKLAEERKQRIARIEVGAKEIKNKTVSIVRVTSVGVVGKKEEVSILDQKALIRKVKEVLKEGKKKADAK